MCIKKKKKVAQVTLPQLVPLPSPLSLITSLQPPASPLKVASPVSGTQIIPKQSQTNCGI